MTIVSDEIDALDGLYTLDVGMATGRAGPGITLPVPDLRW